MNKAVIFDLDGTILYTLGDLAYYINQTLIKFGIAQKTEEEVKLIVGNGVRNLIKRCIEGSGKEHLFNEIFAYYNDIYTNSGSPRTKPYDGIKELLSELKKRGYKLAVLTNKPQISTDPIIEKYFEPNTFDLVVGQREGVEIKPDKQSTLNILSYFGCEPQNAYFVGDGETDVQTSINAGTNGVSVLWGYRTYSQLVQAGAKNFIKSPKELLSIIL